MRPDISSAGIASRRPERNKIHESRMPDGGKNRRRNLPGRGLDRKRLRSGPEFPAIGAAGAEIVRAAPHCHDRN